MTHANIQKKSEQQKFDKDQEEARFLSRDTNLKHDKVVADIVELLLTEAAKELERGTRVGGINSHQKRLNLFDSPLDEDEVYSMPPNIEDPRPMRQKVGRFCATSISLVDLGILMPVGSSCMDLYGNIGSVVVAKNTAKFVESKTSSVDVIAHRLQLGNIAFNAPQSIPVDENATIELLLGINQTIEELKRELEIEVTANHLSGFIDVGQIRVSPTIMQAKLEGSSFTIKPLTPEEQIVSQDSRTEWDWEVIPKQAGKNTIYLTINAKLPIEGSPAYKTMRTFKKEITVDSTLPKQALSFGKENWQWLWTALLVPLGTWMLNTNYKPKDENPNKFKEILKKRREK